MPKSAAGNGNCRRRRRRLTHAHLLLPSTAPPPTSPRPALSLSPSLSLAVYLFFAGTPLQRQPEVVPHTFPSSIPLLEKAGAAQVMGYSAAPTPREAAARALGAGSACSCWRVVPSRVAAATAARVVAVGGGGGRMVQVHRQRDRPHQDIPVGENGCRGARAVSGTSRHREEGGS